MGTIRVTIDASTFEVEGDIPPEYDGSELREGKPHGIADHSPDQQYRATV